jgi:GTPase SAR1 family protein
VVFDITLRETFDNVSRWIKDAKDYGYKEIFIVIGNKVDLESKRQVSEHEARELASKYGVLYAETSAKEYSTSICSYL